MDIELEATFSALKALVHPYTRNLYITRNNTANYCAKLAFAPLFGGQYAFIDIHRSKHQVTYVLHPLNTFSDLKHCILPVLNPQLRRGNFAFKTIEPATFEALAILTQEAWLHVSGSIVVATPQPLPALIYVSF